MAKFELKPVLSPRAAIFWGGMTAAVLDIADPIVYHGLRGVPAIRIFQSVASGLMGRDAFRGGVPTAVLGFVLHTAILMVAAWLFVEVSQRHRTLVRRPLITGPLYGLAIYAVMRWIVVPASRAPMRGETDLAGLLNMLFAHTVLVGLPIVLFAACAQPRPLGPAALARAPS